MQRQRGQIARISRNRKSIVRGAAARVVAKLETLEGRQYFAAISGVAFEDLNGDGVHQAGEPGLPGIQITLDAAADGTVDAFTTSDAAGDYSFNGLLTNKYRVREVGQPNSLVTTPDPADIIVTPADTVTGVDFGNFAPPKITGQVFDDTNGNGIKDPTEHGIPGVTVNFDHGADASIDFTTLTDAAGNYSLINLAPGVNRVTQTAPVGYLQSTANPSDVQVVSSQDVANVNFGDTSQFVVTNTHDGGFGSLRQAIAAANTTPGTNTIRFSIPGAGVHTLTPATPYDIISDTTTLDATTQPGFAGAPLIEIDGSLVGGAPNGLEVTASHSIIRGFDIHGFLGDDIRIAGDFNTVAGCYLGLNAAGTATGAGLSNNQVEIAGGSNNLIGGPTAADRNIIGGNPGNGVEIREVVNPSKVPSTNNTVQGNYIGTDVTGTKAVSNFVGVVISSDCTSNIILHNVISGNGRGVDISGPNNLVFGNYVGTAADGVSPLGNTFGGIQIDTSNTLVGGLDINGPGTGIGAPNVIAFNGGWGVGVKSGTFNQIASNSIFSNAGLGIDLGLNGASPNDGSDDGDVGPNNFTNFPVITSVVTTATGTVITGTLDDNALPGSDVLLQFFTTPASDSSGFGEGKTLYKTVGETLQNGHLTFSLDYPDALPLGTIVTATADTGSDGSSEFSPGIAVSDTIPPAFPTVSINNVTQLEGSVGTTAFTFTVTRTGDPSTPAEVDFFTTDGTATNPGDYQASAGKIIFGVNEASKTITITVAADNILEADESFAVNLINPTNMFIGKGQGIGTILNDDPATPATTLSVNNVTLPEGNSGPTSFVFTVTRSGDLTGPTSVSYFTTDGTATANSDYFINLGIVSFKAGESTKTITVYVNGDTNVEPTESFDINLINPVGAGMLGGQGQGIGTIVNDDAALPPPVAPVLTIGDITQTEGNAGKKNFIFTVTRTGDLTGASSVNFATADGTATIAGGDYLPNSGSLNFAAGQASQTVMVQVNGDTTAEANETYFVNLSSATGAIISDGQATGTIVNDDGAPAVVPTLSVSDISQKEGNSGQKAFTFLVTRSGDLTNASTVHFATADGTAKAASDYTAAAGTVTFAPGESSKPITVQVKGDTAFESNETFKVNLSSAVNAKINKNGVGTILNDDAAPPVLPSLSVSGSSALEGNNGLTAYTFKVTLNQASNSAVTVKFTTADGTAKAGSDYNATTGTVTFAAGQTVQMLTVYVKADKIKEADETFFVNLLSPTNAKIAVGSGKGTIRNDD